MTPNVVIHDGADDLVMVGRGEPFPCRCGGTVAIAVLSDEPDTGAILHTVPPCPPYERLGIRDFYDYLRSGREPTPVAATGEAPKPPKAKR